MDAQNKFRELLKELTPFLKGYGYTRRGQTFRSPCQNNWGLINFQKGRYNTRDRVEFTVNLEVYLQVLSDIWPQWDKDTPPEHGYGHWRERIGFLLADRRDKWWVTDDNTDLPHLVEELKAALALAVAEIDKYIKDTDFRDYLLTGGGTGLTKYHSLLCLSVLVNRYGPQEKLESILTELRAQGITDILRENIEAHISKLKQERTAER
jgi:Domain of unknown function (DUF4304)